jgi:glycerol kinase
VKDARVLAIDQGTTHTKALILNREGRILASASRALAIRFPQPGWVEQDPEELWRSVEESAGECLERADCARPDALGISNQRESVVVWERATGRPLGPCIVWQCRRTAPLCAELRGRGAAKLLFARTGLAIDPLFSATKARWLLEQTPDGLARAQNGELLIGTVDSWVLWKLTGGKVHACDLTNASRTQLMDLRRREWDGELLELFGIPRAALPELRASSGIYGETRDGVPIGAAIGDSHAALFGHAVFAPGAVKATYGTGSSLMTVTDGVVASQGGLSSTVAWSVPGTVRYALEGNILVTGGAVQWLGEFLGLQNPEQVARLAESVTDSGGVYLVPAFVGLGAPYWDDAARGLMAGLTRGTTAGHAARATLEAIAYQVRDVFEEMERDIGGELPVLLADGGASRNDTLMQLQADILGRAVVRPECADVSAMGAAWLAGLAVGVWGSLQEVAGLPREEKRFAPRMAESERRRLYHGWKAAVARARERNQLTGVQSQEGGSR